MRILLCVAALACIGAASAQAPSAKDKASLAAKPSVAVEKQKAAQELNKQKVAEATIDKEKAVKQKEPTGLDKQVADLRKRQDAKGDVAAERQQHLQKLVNKQAKTAGRVSEALKKSGETSSTMSSKVK